jgi:hypothetical protein
MSVDGSRRLLPHDAARDAWGAEAALVLMEMLPPTGWADVATKRDLDALEARTDSRFARIDARFDAVDARFDSMESRFDSIDARFAVIDARFESIEGRFGAADDRFVAVEARLDAKLEAGFRRMIQWNVATFIAGLAAFTALIRLT